MMTLFEKRRDMEVVRTVGVKAVMQQVRKLGLTCGRTAFGEYRIDYQPNDPRYTAGDQGSAYFTDDAEDALGTARLMAAATR